MNEQDFIKLKQTVARKYNCTPAHVIYHTFSHTLDVLEQAERIAGIEGISDKEQLQNLKIAVLYHDVGYLRNNEEHEEISCEILKKDNILYQLSSDQVKTISRLIMATKIPQRSNDILEKVICDADLDYLGRMDFFEGSDLLRQEFKSLGLVHDVREWQALQIRFVETHRYFTTTSQRLREPLKLKHLEKLKEIYRQQFGNK